MTLEDIVLSEISQSHKKANIVGFHLHKVPRVVKFIKTKENRDYRAGRARELLLNGYRVLVG